MNSKILWNKYETAILIDAYIKVRNNEIKRSKAVKSVSEMLRTYAINKGKKIDEKYRNENGISLQMTAIAGLFGEKIGIKNKASYIFREMVDLYINDKNQFNQILKEANIKCKKKDFAEENDYNKLNFTCNANSINNFRTWMKKVKFIEMSKVANYASAILSCEQILKIINYDNPKLYDMGCEVVLKARNLLTKNSTFNNIDIVQNGRLSKALELYVEFTQNNHTEVKNSIETEYNDNKSELTRNGFSEDKSLYKSEFNDEQFEAVLKNNFPRGFRIKSNLDVKKFIRYHNECYGTDWDRNDSNLQNRVRRTLEGLGVIHDEHLFCIDNLINDNTRLELFDYIENNLSKEENFLFYETIFNHFNEKFLADQNNKIYDEQILKSYLMHTCKDKYTFKKNYLSKAQDIEVNAKEIISNLLNEYRVPMKIDMIEKRLPKLPKSIIRETIHNNSEFVMNAKEEYFHINIIDLTHDEVEAIKKLIIDELEKYKFLTGKELVDAIRLKFPNIIERFSILSDLAIRNILSIYLVDDFSFNSNIISFNESDLTIREVFGEFSKVHDHFSLAELMSLKDITGSIIYFDEIYKYAVRINENQFVSLKNINFDIEKTDEAISAFCKSDYIPIKRIDAFGLFPYAGYTWTTYLLESYVAQYSRRFTLVHTGFSEKKCLGAIVKKNSNINSFDDLILNVLKDNGRKLKKDEALKYLFDEGYIGSKRMKNIDTLLMKVSEKKGK